MSPAIFIVAIAQPILCSAVHLKSTLENLSDSSRIFITGIFLTLFKCCAAAELKEGLLLEKIFLKFFEISRQEPILEPFSTYSNGIGRTLVASKKI